MYVMSYFRTEAEALHLAISQDGLHWQALNNNQPIWHSPLGARSVRDPALVRDQEGRFHLLSTDGWKSDSILHATSLDLLHWENARLIPVMRGIEGVRNCWAPECFYDHEASCYRLIWSSAITEPNAPNDGNHRIWGTTTRVFEDFTPAEIFFDPGHSVIDATVVRRGDRRFLMAYKDERGENRPDTRWKAIQICFASRATGPWTETSQFLTPPLSEGPALFERAGGWTMFFDLFGAGRFGALHSADGVHWQDISDQVQFPPGPRHASVLPVDADTARALY